eukprot:gene12-17_t
MKFSYSLRQRSIAWILLVVFFLQNCTNLQPNHLPQDKIGAPTEHNQDQQFSLETSVKTASDASGEEKLTLAPATVAHANTACKHGPLDYTEQTKFTKKELESRDVIIATNIADRGTDLVTSKAIEANNGLHVCIPFLPTNYRVELQNAGRTARQGKKGTAQLVLYSQQPTSITTLRQERDWQEKAAIEAAKNQVAHILFKDGRYRLLPTISECRKEEQALSLEQAWKKNEKDFLNKNFLNTQYKEILDEDTTTQLEKLITTNFNNSSPDLLTKMRAMIGPIIREILQGKLPKEQFCSGRKKSLLDQFCEAHKGKIDADAIESFR